MDAEGDRAIGRVARGNVDVEKREGSPPGRVVETKKGVVITRRETDKHGKRKAERRERKAKRRAAKRAFFARSNRR